MTAISNMLVDAPWLVTKPAGKTNAHKVVPLTGLPPKNVPMPEHKYPFVAWLADRHDAWVEFIQNRGPVLIQNTYTHNKKPCTQLFRITCTFPSDYIHGQSRAHFWICQSDDATWSRERLLVIA